MTYHQYVVINANLSNLTKMKIRCLNLHLLKNVITNNYIITTVLFVIWNQDIYGKLVFLRMKYSLLHQAPEGQWQKIPEIQGGSVSLALTHQVTLHHFILFSRAQLLLNSICPCTWVNHRLKRNVIIENLGHEIDILFEKTINGRLKTKLTLQSINGICGKVWPLLVIKT